MGYQRLNGEEKDLVTLRNMTFQSKLVVWKFHESWSIGDDGQGRTKSSNLLKCIMLLLHFLDAATTYTIMKKELEGGKRKDGIVISL